VLRAVVLTQYRRVTDGRTDRQTDRNAVASAALAMRALRRAVKTYLETRKGAQHPAVCTHTLCHSVGRWAKQERQHTLRLIAR